MHKGSISMHTAEKEDMVGAHVIEIDQLVASLTKGLKIHETSKPLIYRIHPHIRDKQKNAYNPMMLSIGPYNHGIPAAHTMQITKYKFLDYILNLNPEKNLSDFLEAMKGLEKLVRNCYMDDINMGRVDFLKMLLLDGCFILRFLYTIEWSVLELQESNESKTEIDISAHKDYLQSVTNEESTQGDTKLKSVPSNVLHEDVRGDSYPIDQLYSCGFWHDLLLQENQIPFFVVTKIHELIGAGSNASSLKLVEKVIEYVEIALHCYPKAICQRNKPIKFYHLLQLCHMYFIPCLEAVESYNEVKPQMFRSFLRSGSNLLSKYKAKLFHQRLQDERQASPWRRATEYHRAGIEFKKRKYYTESPHSLLDIRFCNGTIEFPCLTIEPNTQTLFYNLIAFEQICPQFGRYITAYIIFLSTLISMPDDVSLLTHQGIIIHQLNNDAEVCDLFKKIGECAAIGFNNDNYLELLNKRIEAYYLSRRPLIRELFGSITSKIHRWTQESESFGFPTTISHGEHT